MGKRGNVAIYVLIGILAATALGLTGDEIIRSVYDSTNTALRANVVVGGSSISGLTTNTIPKATSATTIGNSSVTDNGTTVATAEAFSAGAMTGTSWRNTTGDNGIGFGVVPSGGYNTISSAGGIVLVPVNSANNVAIKGSAAGTAGQLTWMDNSSATIVELFPDGTSTLQLGADLATPLAHTFKGPDGSGTDKTGGSLTIGGGKSTGTGIGGDVVIQTSPSSTTGSALNTLGDRSRALAKYTTLTESVATSFARIAVASGTVVGGEVVLTVEANDGTDFQARTLRFGFSAVNKAGTTTAAVGTTDETVAVSVGTLTCTITAADATNNVDLKANCTSSLTQTVLRANAVITVKNFGTGAISAQ